MAIWLLPLLLLLFCHFHFCQLSDNYRQKQRANIHTHTCIEYVQRNFSTSRKVVPSGMEHRCIQKWYRPQPQQRQITVIAKRHHVLLEIRYLLLIVCGSSQTCANTHKFDIHLRLNRTFPVHFPSFHCWQIFNKLVSFFSWWTLSFYFSSNNQKIFITSYQNKKKLWTRACMIFFCCLLTIFRSRNQNHRTFNRT